METMDIYNYIFYVLNYYYPYLIPPCIIVVVGKPTIIHNGVFYTPTSRNSLECQFEPVVFKIQRKRLSNFYLVLIYWSG